MDTLFKIAAVDGTLHPEEERLLHSAAQIFNIPEQDYQAILASFLGHGPYQGQERGADPGRASNQARDAYQVLGLSPESSDEEVKKTYRSLVAKFHPDKIASKDLPEEFNAFAHAKFKEIQEAYERIKTERGI